MFQKFLKIWRFFFCRHLDRSRVRFIRNIYGDEIVTANGKRSVWCCDRCNSYFYSRFLQKEI